MVQALEKIMKVTLIQPEYFNIWEALGLAYIGAFIKKKFPGKLELNFHQGNFDEDHTIEESGLNSLEENATSDNLYLAIQRFVELSSGRDEAWRKIALSEVTKVLKKKNVSCADEIAKSALFPKKQKPDSLNGNSVAFAKLDPWPDRVDGCSLLNEISSLIKEFIVLSKDEADAIGLWVLHACTLDAYLISPILRITSPTKSCGKSSLLSIIGELVPNPILTANLTQATLFRLVDKHEVTLLLDEVDVSFKRNEDLISLVNSGYMKKTAKVLRCVGEKHEVKSFQCWSAKVLCGIGRLPETTESRSIRIEIKKKSLMKLRENSVFMN